MNNYVALTKCYFCGRDGEIVINRRMRDISDWHGKVINMHPCSECDEKMKQGIMLIVIDSSKSSPDWHLEPMPNPHRTGLVVTVKDHAVKMFIDDQELLDKILFQRWTFIEKEAAEMLGLYDVQ